jgi:metal-dependent amidase/aminoacylase/carboxypeptidase family protein
MLTTLLAERGFGVDPRAGGLDTAFHARAGNGALHIAFIAEYDALPGLGHACGHNLIAASSVGAALMVRAADTAQAITVHVIGTPAEGAAAMRTASTDMGNVSQVVPAIHPYLGIGSLPAVNHQRAFADAAVGPAAEVALRDGATALAWTALDLADR